MQLLTRLNAKAGISEGFGGVPELTTSDIAAALAGANKPGLDVLMGIVCGGANLSAIHDTFYPEAIRLGHRLNWRLRESEAARVGKLLEIAVYETINPNICPSCHGARHSLINPTESCQLCGGTGKWAIYDQQKAKYIGVSSRAYRKTWRERLDELKLLIDRRSHQAKTKIYNNLHEESLT